MTGPQIFALLWGVFAIGLGLLFARFPRFMEQQYEAQLGRSPIGRRKLTPAERRRTIIFYRVGGIVFIAIGVAVIVAAALGALK